MEFCSCFIHVIDFVKMLWFSSDTGERYKLQCDVASSYSILSMGVACFQWQRPSSASTSALQTYCKVEAFNVWMLSQQSYTIDPSSAQFLMEHGFDFNKQFLHGLPYTPLHGNQQQHRTKVTTRSGDLEERFCVLKLSHDTIFSYWK